MKISFPHSEIPARNIAEHIRHKSDEDVETLIKSYLPLALNISLDCRDGKISREAVQRAVQGLLRAIESVPPVIDHKFGTYVAWYVRQALSAKVFNAIILDENAYSDFAMAETASLLATEGTDLSKL